MGAQGTHFISIPIALGSPDTQDFFQGFREAILTDLDLDACKDHQLTRGNFTRASMLHLTIVQMDLGTDEKLSSAKAMMKDLENEF